MSLPFLQVRDLTVERRSPSALILDQVSFDLAPGQALGVLGESGSGKTTLARALLQLLAPACQTINGSILFRGTEMLRASEPNLGKIRGAQISLIFQEPELALNPVVPVGEQIVEVLRAHSKCHRRHRQAEVRSMLAAVGLSDPDIYSAYSHQLSGGQRQRIVIAQALISKPALLIADEPTSALDNVIQAEVLGLLKSLRDRFQLALLFITHNPALLTGLADRVLVMCAGRIVESGSLHQIYWNARHPHTQALLKSIPSFPRPARSERIPLPAVVANAPDASDRNVEKSSEDLQQPLLETRNLCKSYARGRWRLKAPPPVVALENVNLRIFPGSTVALVGKSGSGKSTLGRCLARLEDPDSGEVWFEGKDFLKLRSSELSLTRRRIQLVFQHSATAMNPLFSALDVVAEPLRIKADVSKKQRNERALAIMKQVGIPAESADRSPLEFSGGQRQRLAIARALILKPAILILDEALSGLDCPIQAQIANLLIDLQASLSLSYLFISHDLRVAAYLADTIAVMDRGRIVELRSVTDLFSRPQHAATRELIDSIPTVANPSGNSR